jgi:hypothetical protein
VIAGVRHYDGDIPWRAGVGHPAGGVWGED